MLGTPITQRNWNWSINPSSPADFERLFQEVGTLDHLTGVVHLWSLQAGLTDSLTIPSRTGSGSGVGSVLNLLQALVKHNESASSRLWLVTWGAMPVRPSLPGVAQAPHGGVKWLLWNTPNWGGMLDLAPEATEDEATKLLAEIDDSQGKTISPSGMDSVMSPAWCEATARIPNIDVPVGWHLPDYWWSGGLGAEGCPVDGGTGSLTIELGVVRFQVRRRKPEPTRAGRSQGSSRSRRCVNEGDMVRVLEKVKASMSPLRGVVHAAGVLDDGILLQQDWERFTRVMAPKVKGFESAYIDPEAATGFCGIFLSRLLLGSPSQGITQQPMPSWMS